MKAIITWHDDYLQYNFGETHPFQPIKFQMFKDNLIKELNPQFFIIKEAFPLHELKSLIDPSFVDELLHKEKEQGAMLDPGTPAFPNMVYVARLSVQATYISIKEILKGKYKYGFNVMGGFHHGKPDAAFGGCVLNDIGVAIKKLRSEGINKKIAIIDLDFHPHDGTVEFFKEDPKILMASIHESGWFGFDDELSEYYDNIINFGLTKSVSGGEYLTILKDKIIPKIQAFEPNIIIYVNGVDGHENDSVTYYGRKTKKISLNDENYKEMAEILVQVAIDSCEGKILGLGSGGYSDEDTARVWSQTVQIFEEKL